MQNLFVTELHAFYLLKISVAFFIYYIILEQNIILFTLKISLAVPHRAAVF